MEKKEGKLRVCKAEGDTFICDECCDKFEATQPTTFGGLWLLTVSSSDQLRFCSTECVIKNLKDWSDESKKEVSDSIMLVEDSETDTDDDDNNDNENERIAAFNPSEHHKITQFFTPSM
jgi:endogenous inhibitor of DNA gyrase (YacG/DUF329 family)